ncbi:unnamed protein product [Choristocarpus tenellus]
MPDREEVSKKVPRSLTAIVFRNHYCSHISVKQRRGGVTARDANLGASCGHMKRQDDESGVGGVEETWVTVLRNRSLMEDPHYEGDAQDWHIIGVEEFDELQYNPESKAPLR